MDKNVPITQFDMLTLNESMHLFKAVIPFLENSLQKKLSIIIRINELMQTIHFYNDFPQCSACSDSTPKINLSNIDTLLSNDTFINTIMPYCPEKYVSMLSMFRQYSKMSSYFDLSSMMNFSGDSSDPFSFTMNDAQKNDFNKYMDELSKIDFST